MGGGCDLHSTCWLWRGQPPIGRELRFFSKGFLLFDMRIKDGGEEKVEREAPEARSSFVVLRSWLRASRVFLVCSSWFLVGNSDGG